MISMGLVMTPNRSGELPIEQLIEKMTQVDFYHI